MPLVRGAHTAGMTVLDVALADLGEAETAASRVESIGPAPLPSRLGVAALAQGSVDTAAVAATLILEERGAGTRAVRSDARRVAAAYASERLFTIDGTPPAVWAALSGFFPAADGWLRTHANYPHHARRLTGALGLPGDATRQQLGDALARTRATEAVRRILSVGGVAAEARPADPAEDRRRKSAGILARQSFAGPRRPWMEGELPLAGIRVLDLTRVIAGPVATRTLSLFGADVLRVDSPRLPEIGWQHLDGGAGKRSTLLDLEASRDRGRFDALLADADVIVLGYRPSRLARLGLSPADLVARVPGIVIARLSAWGFDDGDADRRGFDSIVQAASGIAWKESADGRVPGALPVQALDHSAGYLLAAGAMSALRRQRSEGGTHVVSTSLRQVAAHLLSAPAGQVVVVDPDLSDQTVSHESASGLLRYALPAPSYAGSPADFAHPPHPWGSDVANWLPR